jgi:hypothetical protein
METCATPCHQTTKMPWKSPCLIAAPIVEDSRKCTPVELYSPCNRFLCHQGSEKGQYHSHCSKRAMPAYKNDLKC